MFRDIYIYANMHIFEIEIVLIIISNIVSNTEGKFRIGVKGLLPTKFQNRTSDVMYVGK